MKLLLVAAALLLPTAADAQPRRQRPAEQMFHMPVIGPPNAAHCRTPRQQIARENRRHRAGEGHRLDREPPAHMLLAVDRQVDGCHELTFVRREVAPGSLQPPGR